MAVIYAPGVSNLPATVAKNSGFLRWTFGDIVRDVGQVTTRGTLSGGNGYVFTALGDPLDILPDDFGQIFGGSPGHAAVSAAPLDIIHSLAGNGALVARNASPVGHGAGIIYPPSPPNSGAYPPAATSPGQIRTAANSYIPAGARVCAFFVPALVIDSGSSSAGDTPVVCVQTEVLQNGVFKGGVEQPGPKYLSSIRIGIKNESNVGTEISGALYCWIAHSIMDLPVGDDDQSIAVPAS